KPYIVPWLAQGGGTVASAGGMSAHALNGPYHTGQIAQAQATWAATVTSLNTHMANADAHHARLHSYDSTSDHSGTLAWAKVNKSGSSLADLATRLYTDLTSRTHSITGADHSITGAQYSLVGAATTNTLGVLGSANDISGDGGGVVNYLRGLAGAIGLKQITSQVDITLDPTGERILPTGSILKDLGNYNRKWRSLFAAELYVETLVAQDVLATIGGRIMVAPTTKLIADLSSGATTIDVEHNNLHKGSGGSAIGAFIYLATAPGGIAQIEVMKVANGASPTTITGGYRYSVTRNLDGTGANSWVAGDAVVNYGGAVGEGFIELTSTTTSQQHLGPTITIYSRTGVGTWDAVKPVVSLGNLESFVDYAADEFGLAIGNDLALTPTTGFSGL
ncbi:MAG: hypothetical protein ACRC1H_04040, partial [Caldilineaceae bacterium]